MLRVDVVGVDVEVDAVDSLPKTKILSASQLLGILRKAAHSKGRGKVLGNPVVVVVVRTRKDAHTKEWGVETI